MLDAVLYNGNNQPFHPSVTQFPCDLYEPTFTCSPFASTPNSVYMGRTPLNPEYVELTPKSSSEFLKQNGNIATYKDRSTPSMRSSEDVCRSKKSVHEFSRSITDTLEPLEIDTPFLDYLVRHGAISVDMSQSIIAADSANRKHLLLQAMGLSSHVETNCSASSMSSSIALFLNALRHTGQHTIANFLDFGRRITPSPSSRGGTTNPEHRLRGQLSLWIQLNAIKVDPNVYDRFAKPVLSGPVKPQSSGPVLPSFVEYLTTDHSHLSSICSEPCGTNGSVWIDHCPPVPMNCVPDSAADQSPSSSPSCPLGCFARLRQVFRLRKKRKMSTNHPQKIPTCREPPVKRSSTVQQSSSHPVAPHTEGQSPGLINHDAISGKLALLDAKSSEFCNLLLDINSSEHDTLVKYFEQTCGVLVLRSQLGRTQSSADVGTVTSLHVTVVATHVDVVRRLNEMCLKVDSTTNGISATAPPPNSWLADSLSKALIAGAILNRLEVQDFRLRCVLDQQEVQLAIQELSQSNEWSI